MRLDPDHALSPATVEAIGDLFASPEILRVDDAMLLRLAMGIADDEARQLCARAMLASPSVRARLVQLRASIHEEIGQERLGVDERTNLGRLAAFPGRFVRKAAVAVFPGRFEDPIVLDRLVAEGWLDFSEEAGGSFRVSKRARSLVPRPADLDKDAGWAARFVAHYLEVAKTIEGIVAEGRWSDGAARLRRELPNLQAAWNRAEESGMAETVETFARSLGVALLELGAREEFGSLVAAGHRAAEALQRPKLRSWLLSYEGVAAARAGDTMRAKALWTERLRIARSTENHVAEADVLLDLAAQAYSDGDYEGSRRTLAEAEIAVATAGRADYAANVWAMRAVDSLRIGEIEEAVRRAEHALGLLSGVDGIDWGIFVRTSAAQTLVACGRLWSASDALTRVLALCAEGGRPVQAALVLTELASVMEAYGRIDLAEECLAVSLGIHGEIGTRHVEAAERNLEALLDRHPGRPSSNRPIIAPERWSHDVEAILENIAGSRPVASEGR